MRDSSSTTPKPRSTKQHDLTGKRFTRLVVLSFSHRARGARWWLCACDCGKQATVTTADLNAGNTRSCGCYKLDRTSEVRRIHGRANRNDPTYRAWTHLRGRCLTLTDRDYAEYGGRGITVCERWASFENFVADMGERPSPRHSIERINNSGNYEPGNCRWATAQEQANNRRSNVFIEYQGQRRTIMEWSRVIGINRRTISARLAWGWPLERVFTPPASRGNTSRRS